MTKERREERGERWKVEGGKIGRCDEVRALDVQLYTTRIKILYKYAPMQCYAISLCVCCV